MFGLFILYDDYDELETASSAIYGFLLSYTCLWGVLFLDALLGLTEDASLTDLVPAILLS